MMANALVTNEDGIIYNVLTSPCHEARLCTILVWWLNVAMARARFTDRNCLT